MPPSLPQLLAAIDALIDNANVDDFRGWRGDFEPLQEVEDLAGKVQEETDRKLLFGRPAVLN